MEKTIEGNLGLKRLRLTREKDFEETKKEVESKQKAKGPERKVEKEIKEKEKPERKVEREQRIKRQDFISPWASSIGCLQIYSFFLCLFTIASCF